VKKRRFDDENNLTKDILSLNRAIVVMLKTSRKQGGFIA